MFVSLSLFEPMNSHNTSLAGILHRKVGCVFVCKNIRFKEDQERHNCVSQLCLSGIVTGDTPVTSATREIMIHAYVNLYT